MKLIRRYRKSKLEPYTNWHSGESGKEHCVAHRKAMISHGYAKSKLHIQKTKTKVGEGGKQAKTKTEYRVVGRNLSHRRVHV